MEKSIHEVEALALKWESVSQVLIGRLNAYEKNSNNELTTMASIEAIVAGTTTEQSAENPEPGAEQAAAPETTTENTVTAGQDENPFASALFRLASFLPTIAPKLNEEEALTLSEISAQLLAHINHE